MSFFVLLPSAAAATPVVAVTIDLSCVPHLRLRIVLLAWHERKLIHIQHNLKVVLWKMVLKMMVVCGDLCRLVVRD